MGPGETLLGLCIRYTVLRTEYIDGVQRMNQGPEVNPPGAKRFTATQQLQNPDELPSATILTFERRKSLLCTDQDALIGSSDHHMCDRAPG